MHKGVQPRVDTMRIAMSALPPKADMCGATRDVRFVPKADIGRTCGLLGDGSSRQDDFDFRKFARLRIDLD